MRIWNIYQQAIDMGIGSDPRGREAVLESLRDRQADYHALPEAEALHFDKEMLHNPYPDTRLLYGEPTTTVRHVFMGIDIGPAELMLVDRLNQQGADIDLVIAHHPEGIALTTLAEAMALQTDMFSCCGVAVNVAEQILQGEAEKTTVSIVVENYNRSVDMARLLNLPFMCVHTPTDNLVQQFWEQRFAAAAPRRISEIMAMLEAEPEYAEAHKYAAGPMLLAGSERNRPGKIMVDMTGGTDAGPTLYGKLEQAGVGTIVAMHMSNGTLEILQKQHINVILAGHMSSDSLGINLFLDALEAQGVKVTAGSGLTRFSRLEQGA
ncbi:MAG: NGG1p interacting factor NIF3 [Candidatus Sericytochromatia bacterium]|nr:NGG1p interacting factor NIF3 [Candidatus Sericytochromatia bacterium]